MLKKIEIGCLAVVVALATSISGGRAAAQDEDQKTFGSEVDVTVVSIDVFVRDGDGRPVEGLKAEDFKIFQDDVEIPITNFSVLQGGQVTWIGPQMGEVTAPPANLPEAEPSYVLLYVDNEYLQPNHRKRMMVRVRDFVEATMQQQVRMAVASSRRSLDLRQPFTQDRQAVLAALDEVSEETSGWHARNRERHRILSEMDNYAADRDSQRFENVQTNYDFLNQFTVKSMIWSYAEAEADVLVDSLAAMHQAVDFVASYRGRRSIVYMSGGLPMTPGRGLMEEYAEVFQDRTIFNRIAEMHKGNSFLELTVAANSHSVRLYALDSTGLNSLEGFTAEDRFAPEAKTAWTSAQNLQESLGFMADATGALAILNTNDVADGLGLIQDDLLNFYSLGYTIAPSGVDSNHMIRIEVPSHPEYTVRHRGWITDKSLETRVEEQVQSALYRDTKNNPMGLELTSGPPKRAKGKRWQVPFDLAIPVRNLTMVRENDHWVGHIEITLGARDERGREIEPSHHQLEIRVPAVPSQPLGNVLYRLSLQMVFRNKDHTVVVGVMDSSSQRKSVARTEIELH